MLSSDITAIYIHVLQLLLELTDHHLCFLILAYLYRQSNSFVTPTLPQRGFKPSSLVTLFLCPQAASVLITRLSLNTLSCEWHVSNCGLCQAIKSLQKESFWGISVGQQLQHVCILNATCCSFVNVTSVLPGTAFLMSSGLVHAGVYRQFTLAGHGIK